MRVRCRVLKNSAAGQAFVVVPLLGVPLAHPADVAPLIDETAIAGGTDKVGRSRRRLRRVVAVESPRQRLGLNAVSTRAHLGGAMRGDFGGGQWQHRWLRLAHPSHDGADLVEQGVQKDRA